MRINNTIIEFSTCAINGLYIILWGVFAHLWPTIIAWMRNDVALDTKGYCHQTHVFIIICTLSFGWRIQPLKSHVRVEYGCWELYHREWRVLTGTFLDRKVHGANMWPIWGRQVPGGPTVGPISFAISEFYFQITNFSLRSEELYTSNHPDFYPAVTN